MDSQGSGKVKSEDIDNQKVMWIDSNRHATRSTSSLSNSNSPRSSSQNGFKSNIPFPSLRSPLNRRNKNKSTIQFRTDQSVEEVKQERQEQDLETKLRHPKVINDKLEFTGLLGKWNHSSRNHRGKSLGALNQVNQEKEQVEVKVKNKYNTKVVSFIDKDEFNQGVRSNNSSKIQQSFGGSRVLPEQINSIAEIEQSKEGLSVSINMRSSLKQIVDQADPPERQREEPHQRPIESIKEEKGQEEGNEQPLLRVSLHKLQGQQDIMKKIIKSQEIQINSQNEPSLTRMTESIIEQNEGEGENEENENQQIN